MLKFKFGPPPDNALVLGDPAWKPISGLETTGSGARRILAVGAANTVVAFTLWKLFVPGALQFAWPAVSSLLFVVVVLVVVHEVLHLLAFPGLGFGNAIAGFWPARGAAYAGYTLPISRRRFAWVTLTPLLVLTAGVLALAICGVRIPDALQWASVLNAFGSGADLLVVVLVVRQLPKSALILGSGQQLYMREC